MLSALLIFALVISTAQAQSPSASGPPAAPAKATPTPSPSSTPSHPVTTEELINSLSSADLQTAMTLLKKNFTNPEALNETQLNRAALQGLLARLSNGLILLPAKPPSDQSIPFYGEILEGHIGYLRLGTFSLPNLQAMDKKLADFAAKKVDALVIDLRVSGAGDFATAAEFARRFVPKGKPLFTLRKQGKQDRTFISEHDPVYGGLIVILTDIDTSGASEAFAVALRAQNKSLLIGQQTAGGAVEYSDLPLPSGKILRVAVSDCVGADGRALYPDGVKPDLPVEMSEFDKRQIFQVSTSKGMSLFIHEIGRPHLNEAALIAGTNPELETSEMRRNRAQGSSIHDAVLQRALDLVTSLEVYQKR
jgi:hypothetical protein